MRTPALVTCCIVCLCAGTPLAAEPPEPGPRLAASVGGSVGDGGAAPAVGFAIGYRFRPYVGVEFELATTPGLDFEPIRLAFIDFPILDLVLPNTIQTSGSILTLLLNVIAEIPTTTAWLHPYVFGGGGLGHINQRFALEGRGLLPRDLLKLDLPSFPPALTAGGGVDFEVSRGWAVGASARYTRLLVNGDAIDLARLGARISVRF